MTACMSLCVTSALTSLRTPEFISESRACIFLSTGLGIIAFIMLSLYLSGARFSLADLLGGGVAAILV